MIGLFNAFIRGLGNILTTLLSVLPNSPFQIAYNADLHWLQVINYVLPFSQAVAHLEVYVISVVGYYAIRIVLKWVKAAGN